ncbi:hypothetical protein IVB30_10475 [Bradyrhizobium sp. 200]|uniref:hypothetical protein n=1 Tax=Bradyrhizobium sp. 200 TaxID=2782665 RepID=UPI001FFED69D|nr:hypothetical protein [Bradyrhizobium sp. 200]UPJ51730.1 hypothetical protein IVB30_10475 [Bradyrhizobium sp. 200]
MPYNILHVIPYMHASAGGPPVVVENFISEASRPSHRSKIVSTLDYCNGDENSLQKHIEQLAPTTFLTGVETTPVIGRTMLQVRACRCREAFCARTIDVGGLRKVCSPATVRFFQV